MLRIEDVGSISGWPLLPVTRFPLESVRVNSGVPFTTEIVLIVPVTVVVFPLASVLCAETVFPIRLADCITAKFDWNELNDDARFDVACSAENCASSATD